MSGDGGGYHPFLERQATGMQTGTQNTGQLKAKFPISLEQREERPRM